MKSILFLSVMNGSAWGGSEEQWFRLVLWMAKEKYDVTVSCFDWPEKTEKLTALQNEGIKFFLLPSKSKGVFAKWQLQLLVNKIPFENYDLVFINQGGFEDITHAPFKIIYKRCKKYVISSHNYDENGQLSLGRTNLLKKWFLNASLNIGASQKIFDTLKNKFRLFVNNPKIIYSPINFDVPFAEEIYPSSVNDLIIFTMLAAFDVNRKAQDVLIKTFNSEKWKTRNWQLHLYGQGKDLTLLETIINENALQEKVLLKGHTADVKKALLATHMYLQITRLDAMPISVMEAMAMARPCIVSNVGDMPVWVKHEDNGYISSSVTVEAIDEVLELAWHQKEQWNEMGKKSFKKFQELYPHPYEEKIISLLKSL
ncbi:MAG: glycosyltransferase family 4 protein [Chitinophagaceae bacterium]